MMLGLLFGVLAAGVGRDVVPINVEGTLCHPNRLMVKLSRPDALKSVSRAGARVLRTMPEIGWAVVESKPGRLISTRNLLKATPGIASVTFDRAARPAYDPNDALWPDMWHFRTIKANLAWDISFGSDATVAVIDTGVVTTHEDLAANIWHNAGEIPANNIDDDGNGYVDDTVGYDFAYNDNDPDDQYGHGTPCAGLVGAVQDNTVGVTGVAPHAKIMCLKACIDSGYFYDSMTVPAYLYASHMGAKVLSMSYFSDQVSQSERDAIDYCFDHGTLPVAAAGNSASVIPYYPGAYENTLGVAAITGSLNKAGFSNYGTWVDVAAPGVSLYSTTKDGGYTSGFGGTSGATPHVAGLATLLFGAKPSATPQEVRNAIEDTATNLDQPPYGEFSNYGLINCEAAMQAILNGPAPARTPVVRYVTPIGAQFNDIAYPDERSVICRVYGRGFQQPRQVAVSVGGVNLPVQNQRRDFFDFAFKPPANQSVQVRVDGQVVAQFNAPQLYRTCFPLIEASSPGATVTGGFYQALVADGTHVTCSRNGDGRVSLQATLRKVTTSYRTRVIFKRYYTNSPSSTETVYLYDWSSASYPYGNWVAIQSGSAPGAMATMVEDLGDIARFIDPEGTMYVLIQTSTDLPEGSKLMLDQFILAERP